MSAEISDRAVQRAVGTGRLDGAGCVARGRASRRLRDEPLDGLPVRVGDRFRVVGVVGLDRARGDGERKFADLHVRVGGLEERLRGGAVARSVPFQDAGRGLEACGGDAERRTVRGIFVEDALERLDPHALDEEVVACGHEGRDRPQLPSERVGVAAGRQRRNHSGITGAGRRHAVGVPVRDPQHLVAARRELRVGVGLRSPRRHEVVAAQDVVDLPRARVEVRSADRPGGARARNLRNGRVAPRAGEICQHGRLVAARPEAAGAVAIALARPGESRRHRILVHDVA